MKQTMIHHNALVTHAQAISSTAKVPYTRAFEMALHDRVRGFCASRGLHTPKVDRIYTQLRGDKIVASW